MAKRDMGVRIATLARDLTPAHLAEMLAIAKTMRSVGSCLPLLKAHYSGLAPIIRSRLVTWEKVGGAWGPKWRRCNLTKLGWMVLLARLSDEVAHILPPIPEPEGD